METENTDVQEFDSTNSKKSISDYFNKGKSIYLEMNIIQKTAFWFLIMLWMINFVFIFFGLINQNNPNAPPFVGIMRFNLVSILVNTILWGSLYLAIAVGLTLTYKLLGFPNFAHAEFLVVGGFTAIFLQSLDIFKSGFLYQTLLIWGLLFGFLVAGLVAVSCDLLIFKPLRQRNATPQTMMISSLGLALLLRGILLLRFTNSTYEFTPPASILSENLSVFTIKINAQVGLGFAQPFIEFDGLSISIDEFFLAIVILAMVYGVNSFLSKSRTGKAMRAVSDNPSLAASSGVNIERINLISWFIGGGLAGIGGTLFAMLFSFRAETGAIFLLPAFAVVVLGTVGSITGVLIAAYVIGFTRSISEPILTGFGRALDRSSYTSMREIAPFVVLILILLFFNEGIGKRLEDKQIEEARNELQKTENNEK